MTSIYDVVHLRLYIGRLAQIVGVDNRLNVTNKSYDELTLLARDSPYDWEDLARMTCERVKKLVDFK